MQKIALKNLHLESRRSFNISENIDHRRKRIYWFQDSRDAMQG